MSNQWGYMNPETYVAKPKQVKGLGMLESKSSDSDSDAESETETRKKAESMLAEMAKFLDTMEKDENSKAEKEKSKKRKKEEKKENNEPSEFLRAVNLARKIFETIIFYRTSNIYR